MGEVTFDKKRRDGMDKDFQAQINRQFKALTDTRSYQVSVEGQVAEADLISVYFWRIIPEYLLSICPFCGEPHRQQLDLYSLYGWHISGGGQTVAYSPNGHHNCKHFTAVHGFLNLNGRKPQKRALSFGLLRSTEPEVPFVSSCLLPDDLESRVVLHSLPICRIEGETFIPTYTLYLLTYYAQDAPTIIYRRHMQWANGPGLRYMPDFARLPMYWEQVQNQSELWDLEAWWRQGRLFWIDPVTMKLNDLTVMDFPYRAIKGVRHGYIFRGGKFTEQATEWTMERFQAGVAKLRQEQEEAHQRMVNSGDAWRAPHIEAEEYFDTSRKYDDFYDVVAKKANGEVHLIRHYCHFLPGQPPDLLTIKAREEFPLSALTPDSRTNAERIAAALDGGDTLVYGKSYAYYMGVTETSSGKADLTSK